MKARTYYDDDNPEGRPTFTRAGIRPSKALKRASRVIDHAFKTMGLPFDDRSHLPVRRYIARMKLTPAQIAMLARMLRNGFAGSLQLPGDDERCDRYGCTYREYRQVLFYTHRAALSLLVETPPRSPLDLDDLLEILMARPGALPTELQANVAIVIGDHVEDTIAGRPFKPRPLVKKGGAR